MCLQLFLNVLGLFLELSPIFQTKLSICWPKSWFFRILTIAFLFGPILACITVMSPRVCKNILARVLLSADIRISLDKMLKDLDWVRLTNRWDHHLLVQAFKCLKGMHLLICLQFLPLLILFAQSVLVVNLITLSYSKVENKFWQEDIKL